MAKVSKHIHIPSTHYGTRGAGVCADDNINPHAVTSIGSIDYIYDNNGNLTTVSPGSSNIWNYNNKLVESDDGTITVTYVYDVTGQRVKLYNGTTTIYPTKYYNTDGTTITKHIFANGAEVATITGSGESVTLRYVHTDTLTSSNIITDANNTIDETLDYFPFGNIRIDSGSYSDQRKYIGQEYDADTGLNYLNARYYDGNRGQFISQDSVFTSIGDENKVQEIFGKTQKELLMNPQSLNSYSYANNNPITNSDPKGNTAVGICGCGSGGIPGLYGGGSLCGVVAFSFSPLNMEIGLISSGEGGGSTAVGSVSANGSLMLSNADNIEI